MRRGRNCKGEGEASKQMGVQGDNREAAWGLIENKACALYTNLRTNFGL